MKKLSKPDLSANVAGIHSPNPFWLASGPPTNSAYQVRRAFEAGWGGAVWKTLGEPIVNVASRYGAIDYDGRKIAGLNNIELITDRPLEENLEEIRQVKREFPDHAVVVSLMVESSRDAWHEIVKRTQDTGCDGLELNFGCPHGMSERGMGSAVGQVPEYTEQITRWVMEAAEIPVLVKLTPNVTDVRFIGRAARAGGADGLSLINTINSIVGVDLDSLATPPASGRPRQPRRILRSGSEAHRAEHGAASGVGPRRTAAGVGHRWGPGLARRRRVFASRRWQRPGLYCCHALRISYRRNADFRTRGLDARERLFQARRFRRP